MYAVRNGVQLFGRMVSVQSFPIVQQPVCVSWVADIFATTDVLRSTWFCLCGPGSVYTDNWTCSETLMHFQGLAVGNHNPNYSKDKLEV